MNIIESLFIIKNQQKLHNETIWIWIWYKKNFIND